jgi:hypothetical protein
VLPGLPSSCNYLGSDFLVPQIPPKKKADRGKSGKKWDYIGFIWGYIRIMG